MRTEIIRDWNGFYGLKEEWNELLSRSRADIIFLRWEWIDSWRSIHGKWVTPFIVSVYDDDGEMIAIGPFYKTRYTFVRMIPYMALRILGDFPTGAECLDWIVRSDREDDGTRAIVQALDASLKEWDFMWMPYVPMWTGARDRICNAAIKNGYSIAEQPVKFGIFDIPGIIEEMFAPMGSSHRYNVRRDLRKTFGDPATRFITCKKEEDIPRYLDSLFHLHYVRWSQEGQVGTFRKKPNEARFYRAFSPVAMNKGWLGIYGVSMSEVLKAVQFGYIYNGSFLQMQEGFDPEYGKGLGNLLRFKVIESLIACGVKTYDFLGEMSVHKQRWHAVEREGWHMMVGNRKLKNRVLFGNNVWPTGRHLLHTDAERFRGQDGK